MFENEKKVRNIMKGLLVAALLSFFALMIVSKLFDLQIIQNEYYLDKVLDNIQKETILKAKRGLIYDCNMNQLATNVSVYRIFISPADIKKPEDDRKIAEGLSRILSLDYDDVYEMTQKKEGTGSRDRTVKKNVQKEQADEVRIFIAENSGYNSMIYLEEGTMRYYPSGTLACHVIGSMGTDKGLMGIEYQYNTELSGTNGIYVTAKNALGEELPSEYEKYVEPKDGYNVVTTIDSNIQSILESQLKLAYENDHAGNRVCGVVMNVNNGGILGMATYPGFDLNDPYTLNFEYKEKLEKSGYEEGSDDYKKLASSYLYKMWNNKTLNDTYYPGSTFKPVTSCMAFQENVTNENTVYTCPGYWVVAGRKIGCANTRGHGTHEFSYMLAQSCNPTMMQVVEKIGAKKFYEYFISFGYTQKTGIDLPGEALGVVFDEEKFGIVDLAVSSFGQGFTTTVIRQISSICTVANGGYLVSPHVVSRLTDSNGNTVVEYESTARKKVVDSETAARVSAILAQGVIDGGAKNAYVAGYRVAAKTGTSEKIGYTNPETGESGLVVSSCVAYAPADDPQIAIIIVVDEPHPTSGGRYGSVMAAPFIANSLEQILPYIGIEAKYSEQELAAFNVTVGDYTGMSLEKAKNAITGMGAGYEIVGDGSYIVAQVPVSGEIMRKSDGKIILYTGEPIDGKIDPDSVNIEYSTVPALVGSYTYKAISDLRAAGFNVRVTGSTNYVSGTYASVSSQSVVAGSSLPKGSVIVINSIHLSGIED